MNTLNLIRKQIQKAAALHDAQITHVAYRGVAYDTRCVEMSSRLFPPRPSGQKALVLRAGAKIPG